MLLLGSAVRLPYHQPEKKDLSVFLARTELKQQKFVGSSRLSWKQFVPPGISLTVPASSVTEADSSLSLGAVSLEKVAPALQPETNSAVVTESSVQESYVLPDLSSLCSRPETVLSDVPSTSAELKDTQEQVSSKCVRKKLLLLSPVKSTSMPDPLCEVEPDDLENLQVDTLLAPAIGKKLLLDTAEKNKFNPSASVVTEIVSSETIECMDMAGGVLDCVVANVKDEEGAVAKIPQQLTTAKIPSRAFRRVLPSNIPLPQLSGNPHDFIELDGEDGDGGEDQEVNSCDQGVEQLLERLLQHTRCPIRSRKPKTVEIR